MPPAGHHCPSPPLSTVSEGVERGAPVTRVYSDSNGSFVLLAADCPADPADYDGGLVVTCMSCLLEQHPEAGRGLDLAKRHGAAHLDEGGEWMIGGEA